MGSSWEEISNNINNDGENVGFRNDVPEEYVFLHSTYSSASNSPRPNNLDSSPHQQFNYQKNPSEEDDDDEDPLLALGNFALGFDHRSNYSSQLTNWGSSSSFHQETHGHGGGFDLMLGPTEVEAAKSSRAEPLLGAAEAEEFNNNNNNWLASWGKKERKCAAAASTAGDDESFYDSGEDRDFDGKRQPKKKKAKKMPAKNLNAERRRRKKLNDRLYTLRSIVPNITKMDRASIIRDAIDYVNELTRKINDLQEELAEPSPCVSSVTTAATTPIGSPTPISSPSQHDSPVRVEVKQQEEEERCVSIHVYCRHNKPGLITWLARAMEGLGLDVQQAVVSCFDGLVLDVYKAEQRGGYDLLHPDQIKAVLMNGLV